MKVVLPARPTAFRPVMSFFLSVIFQPPPAGIGYTA